MPLFVYGRGLGTSLTNSCLWRVADANTLTVEGRRYARLDILFDLQAFVNPGAH